MTGPELQARRLELGLTQEQLAAEIGMPRSSIAQWESGSRTITRARGALLDQELKRLEGRAGAVRQMRSKRGL